jgi:circadian clock protein KaiC
MFAFDESLATLRARMNAIGINFREGSGPGQIEVHQMDPAEVAPGEFIHMVRSSVENDNAKIVVIDSLNGYLNAMPEERFLLIQLHELLSYLGRKGVTTILVISQHGLVGTSMRTPLDLSYLADSVVVLRYFELAGKVKKAISVLKKRSGFHEDTIREISFSKDGINVSHPLERFRGILTGIPVPVNEDPIERASNL